MFTPRNTKAAFNALIGIVNKDYLLNVGAGDCFCNWEDMLKLRVAAEGEKLMSVDNKDYEAKLEYILSELE